MELLKEYSTPWIISNISALIFLLTAILKPKLTRLLFALLFFWASWINYTTVHNSPNEYLFYAELTPVSLYTNFINGWFKLNIIYMVTIISFGQGLIAIGILLKGWIVRLSCFGAIVFFIAITPLGIGSGFPATIVGCISIYYILKKDDLNYIWRLRTKKQLQ